MADTEAKAEATTERSVNERLVRALGIELEEGEDCTVWTMDRLMSEYSCAQERKRVLFSALSADAKEEEHTEQRKQREAIAAVRALVQEEVGDLLVQSADDSLMERDGLASAIEQQGRDPAKEPSGPALRRWMTDACVRRYLVARDWDVNKASKMLVATVQWRAEYRPWDSPRSVYHEEAAPTKMYVSGVRDREGRPLIMMRPARDTTGAAEAEIKVRYLVWALERAIAIMDTANGVEKVSVIIDLTNSPNKMHWNITKTCAHIMQNHYPERMGVAFFLNPPWVFWAFWSAISAFLDPNTRRKVNMVKKKQYADLLEFFEEDQVEEDHGGSLAMFELDLEQWLVYNDVELPITVSSSEGERPETEDQVQSTVDPETNMKKHHEKNTQKKKTTTKQKKQKKKKKKNSDTKPTDHTHQTTEQSDEDSSTATKTPLTTGTNKHKKKKNNNKT